MDVADIGLEIVELAGMEILGLCEICEEVELKTFEIVDVAWILELNAFETVNEARILELIVCEVVDETWALELTACEVVDEAGTLEFSLLIVMPTIEGITELGFPKSDKEFWLIVASEDIAGVNALPDGLWPRLPYPWPYEKLGSPVYDEEGAPTVVDELLATADVCCVPVPSAWLVIYSDD